MDKPRSDRNTVLSHWNDNLLALANVSDNVARGRNSGASPLLGVKMPISSQSNPTLFPNPVDRLPMCPLISTRKARSEAADEVRKVEEAIEPESHEQWEWGQKLPPDARLESEESQRRSRKVMAATRRIAPRKLRVPIDVESVPECEDAIPVGDPGYSNDLEDVEQTALALVEVSEGTGGKCQDNHFQAMSSSKGLGESSELERPEKSRWMGRRSIDELERALETSEKECSAMRVREEKAQAALLAMTKECAELEASLRATKEQRDELCRREEEIEEGLKERREEFTKLRLRKKKVGWKCSSLRRQMRIMEEKYDALGLSDKDKETTITTLRCELAELRNKETQAQTQIVSMATRLNEVEGQRKVLEDLLVLVEIKFMLLLGEKSPSFRTSEGERQTTSPVLFELLEKVRAELLKLCRKGDPTGCIEVLHFKTPGSRGGAEVSTVSRVNHAPVHPRAAVGALDGPTPWLAPHNSTLQTSAWLSGRPQYLDKGAREFSGLNATSARADTLHERVGFAAPLDLALQMSSGLAKGANGLFEGSSSAVPDGMPQGDTPTNPEARKRNDLAVVDDIAFGERYAFHLRRGSPAELLPPGDSEKDAPAPGSPIFPLARRGPEEKRHIRRSGADDISIPRGPGTKSTSRRKRLRRKSTNFQDATAATDSAALHDYHA